MMKILLFPLWKEASSAPSSCPMGQPGAALVAPLSLMAPLMALPPHLTSRPMMIAYLAIQRSLRIFG